MGSQDNVSVTLDGVNVEVKAGARNSRADINRLREIQGLIANANRLLAELGLDNSEDQPADNGGGLGDGDLGGKAVEVDENGTAPPTPELSEGNALKALAFTDDTLRVGNYIALWGGRDLEGIFTDRVNKDGSTGEYFTDKTDFDSGYTRLLKRLPLDWEHRQNADGGIGPSQNDVLGYVDWPTAKADSIGLWVERVLDRHNRYVQALEGLIEAGIIGTSSEAIPEQVVKGDDGEIKRWPLRSDTLTVSPMESRMITDNHIAALKAVAANEPEVFGSLCESLKSLICEKDGEAEGDGEPGNSHLGELERVILETEISLLQATLQ